MLFERGYDRVREKVENGGKYIRSCGNCSYCIDSKKGYECNNDEVTYYDVIVDGNNTYCSMWKPYTKREENVRKVTGRSILDYLEEV